jgi:hypothetical protein
MMAERRWTSVLLPLAAAVPAVILVNCWMEASFAEKWFDRITSLRSDGVVPSWNLGKVSA